jgi:hypothetical protein
MAKSCGQSERWKYPALSLNEKYAAMRKAGFEHVGSNPANSQPIQ